MLKIIISGCSGRMGQVIASLADADSNIEIAAGFDVNAVKKNDFPVYSSPMEYTGDAEVVIDFSSPAALDALIAYAKAKKIPMVLATTGYTPKQEEQIIEASKFVPVFRSANFSIGINLLEDLVKRAASILGKDFDIEIVERHHRNKVDAPSGTALMLARAATEGRPDADNYVYDRHSVRQSRADSEIGISAVRGGSIAGDHEVIFAGLNEVIEIKHHAASREVFATGALRAARYIATVTEPGMYSMKDLIASI